MAGQGPQEPGHRACLPLRDQGTGWLLLPRGAISAACSVRHMHVLVLFLFLFFFS